MRVVARERENEREKGDEYVGYDGKRTADIACLTMLNDPERFVTVRFGNAVFEVSKR